MNFFLNLSTETGWIANSNKDIQIFFKGYLNNLSISNLIKHLSSISFNEDKLDKFFKKLDGHFSIILIQKDALLIAVDRISSIPIILVKKEKNIFIADNYTNLLGVLKKKKKLSLDTRQTRHLAMSGFTFGSSGVFKEVIISNPGSFLLLKNKLLIKKKYHDWRPFKKQKCKSTLLKSKLIKINNNIISKLIKTCNNRFIVIPLSAGYDSRFILSGLIDKGYKNIITFSYGRKENRELNTARKIAEYLKVPWNYIEFTNYNKKKIAISETYTKFKYFSDTTQSVHFPQDFQAIHYLKNNKIIPKDSIIVNGQSGDFITGNHIPELKEKNSFDEVFHYFFLKHYKIWKSLMSENKEIIKKSFLKRVEGIKNYDTNVTSSDFLIEAFQKIEYEDRQIKYVVSGQKAYEFFGYEWRLPLWDNDYIDFWEKVDIAYKIKQNLYREVLKEQNWGDVWHKFPLNPPNTFSVNMQFIRFLFKCIFLLYGKNKWHAFEKRYLDYYMNPLCGYAPWSYLKIMKDNRGFTNSLSFYIEEYLQEKGTNWKGIV